MMQNCNIDDNYYNKNGCFIRRKHTAGHSGQPATTTQFWLSSKHRRRHYHHHYHHHNHWQHSSKLRWSPPNILSSIFVFISPTILLLLLSLLLVLPTISSEFTSNSGSGIASQHNSNKNSGQFYISQLCAGKSQFPVTKRVEGAILTSNADSDVNCTITFRTKSAQQHFVIRFEELKLGCDDHLKMFDGDLDYGQPSIKDFSCRDSLASVPIIKTTGTFLTMRFSSDSKAKLGDGFRLVATAVFDVSKWDCPPDYAFCRNHLCISRSLFCDDVNHCLDNSDEASCSLNNGGIGGTQAGSIFAGESLLASALGLLLVLVLIIFTCVSIFISAIYCRRESHYTQYQHHLQRAIGVPLQTSSSLMFTNHQPQYHYFQPANLSPYITPQHHALASTLPRGYSTLPLNLATRQQQQPQHHHQQQPSPILTKGGNNFGNNEYLMMAGLTGPPTASMQSAPTMQTNLFLPTSQSILPGAIRYQPPAGS